jgi:hypothetical protein
MTETMTSNQTTRAQTKPKNPAPSLRGFLFFDGLVRLLLWQGALAITVGVCNALRAWPTWPIGTDAAILWNWASRIGHLIIGFNLVYLLELLLLRRLIPTPKEGHYDFVGAGAGFRWELVWVGLVSILIRARFEPPFPGFLVFHLANLPPFCWLMSGSLGPKSKSCFVLDPPIPDPSFTEIGRNVTLGWGTSITAHIHDREGVTLKNVVIEDDVMIGAEVLIYGGTRIKRGAVIYGGAVIRPDTVIGENEAWGGVPAKKVKDLPALT